VATGYGVDFNPQADRVRIVTGSGLNFRINPSTGAPIDADPVTIGINPDGSLNGGSTTASAVAYTNAFAGATATVLYALDPSANSLWIINPPNNGTMTGGVPVTLNGSPLDFTGTTGLEIVPSPGIHPASADPTASFALAALTVGGSTGLYWINLSTGAATLNGTIGSGTALSSLAVCSATGAGYAPVSWTTVAGTQYSIETSTDLVHWQTLPGTSTATGTATTVPVELFAGEIRRFWRAVGLYPGRRSVFPAALSCVSCPYCMKKRLFLSAACLLATAGAQTPVPPPAAAVIPAATPAVVEEEGPQYIRVEKTADAVQLQTALVHFKKAGVTLDLVGAIHIADAKFYHDLNTRFEGYDALLWEGIGGPKIGAAAPPPAPEPDANEDGSAPAVKKKGNLDGLHTAYVAGAKWLGLAFQLNEVDYRKENFVHADLTMDEFNDLQAKRGESLLGFMIKAGIASATAKHPQEPSSLKLLTSAIKGDKNGLKRELVGTLGAADDEVTKLTGDSVIISDRNAKCLQVLDEQVAAGKKKLGIFYGAAHFTDMEKRLVTSGWEKTGSEWMVAWDIAN
jgi:hypothetical protein